METEGSAGSREEDERERDDAESQAGTDRRQEALHGGASSIRESCFRESSQVRSFYIHISK